MSEREIIRAAELASNEFGFKALVLQSGEDPYYSEARLLRIVKGIKKRCGVLLFLSIGESVPISTYRKLYRAGAHAALMRFETSNPVLYKKLHRTPFSSRANYLRALKRIGFVLATGALIGLPGQTSKDIAKDILYARGLGADMLSFGPFIPAPGTALARAKRPALPLVLKTLAALRLAIPGSKILATTALETLDSIARRRALLSGANSLMINVTPARYRKLYTLYPGKADSSGAPAREIARTVELLRSLGRAPTDLGFG